MLTCIPEDGDRDRHVLEVNLALALDVSGFRRHFVDCLVDVSYGYGM